MLTHDDIVGDIYAERIVDALDIHSDNVYSEVDRMVAEYENTIRADAIRKFAIWLRDHDYLNECHVFHSDVDYTQPTVNEVLHEYKREKNI